MIQATVTFKSKYFITLYNYIYIYYTYKYVSYTYFKVYVEVFVCFEIVTAYFRCEFLCSLRPCYVVYEVTNIYNDMGMKVITRRR